MSLTYTNALAELSGRMAGVIPTTAGTGTEGAAALARAVRTIDSLASYEFLQSQKEYTVSAAVNKLQITTTTFLVTGETINRNKELKMFCEPSMEPTSTKADAYAFQLERVPMSELKKKRHLVIANIPTCFSYYMDTADSNKEYVLFNATFATPYPKLTMVYSRTMRCASGASGSDLISVDMPVQWHDLIVDVAVWQQKEKYGMTLSEVDRQNVVERLKQFAAEYNASLDQVININDEAIRRGQ